MMLMGYRALAVRAVVCRYVGAGWPVIRVLVV